MIFRKAWRFCYLRWRQLCRDIPCVTSMHMCIMTHIGSSLPDLFTTSCHLPKAASASLRLLYSLLYGEHINHIQVLGFLPFPYSFCAQSPLSVWPISNNITAFVFWVYNPHMREIWLLAFWAWLTSLKTMFSSSIHLPENDKI
jgi:hypothetical protein